MNDEVVKMSPKEQLVVPKEIREETGFKPSDRFIAISMEDGMMFKRVNLDIQGEYERLSEKVQDRLNDKEVSRDEIDDAVEWARE
ncbi:MAG: hypothetical protein BRC29_02235 [Nanohaloarchaea archaeon SW_7_43_1]|nr:MAG: hypothetical protein BRC29_02235 [Nanohaloarchaea archaeon SW_7_43_1]